LSCDDGEEQHLLEVAAHVKEHVERLTREHGQVGDERLLLMASILITDELFEARRVADQALASPLQRIPPGESAASRRPPLPGLQTASQPEVPRLQTSQTAIPPVVASSPAPQALPPQPQPPEPPSRGIATPAPAALKPSPPIAARTAELLDANALMRGLERKAGRP
jgi:cell division protein ZapA